MPFSYSYTSENIICIKVVFKKKKEIFLMAKIFIIPSTGESLLIHSVTGYVTSLD